MHKIGMLFPHQLFTHHEIHDECDVIYLVEEFLFFREFSFHQQKIAFHRASMKAFESTLANQGIRVEYVSSLTERCNVRKLITHLNNTLEIEELHYIDPTDEWLSKRIQNTRKHQNINIVTYENPSFINTKSDLSKFFRPDKKSFFQTSFYKQQRLNLNLLIEDGDQPTGGKWTFDTENRKKYPKSKTPPVVTFPQTDSYWKEAMEYVEKNFADNPGKLSPTPFYPITENSARSWFKQFLQERFHDFGVYEDAIVSDQSILNHSLLSPLINAGLLNPLEVVHNIVNHAKTQDIPINSTEGLVRQLIGWREFIRGMYEAKGNFSRTTNYWGFKRKIPQSFYDGSTGIPPIDITIKKVLKTGYCHHIERLMVLGNFMLLCEFDPDEVYRWFMELFIDAYDWVMVPNVYGMSQFADGGLFATKPYISGSNYLMKMSNYEKGDWQKVWDGLFWRFMNEHRSFFEGNPRTGMLLNTLKRMDEEKRKNHFSAAEQYLNQLDKS